LQNLFNEKSKNDSEISDSSKVSILNRYLPENLRWINVFHFQHGMTAVNILKETFQE